MSADTPVREFSRAQPSLRRLLFVQHAREVVSSALGAALGLVVGAAVILALAGRVEPLAAGAFALAALLGGVGLVLGRHGDERDYRRDLAQVVRRLLPYTPRRPDLGEALVRATDSLCGIYWRRDRSAALRRADAEHRLVVLLGELLVDAARIAQWLEFLDEGSAAAPGPEPPLQIPLPSRRELVTRASAERYRQAIEHLQSARRALQDERQSLEMDFRALMAQVESLCLAARQIEVGQARLDTAIKEQVLDTREFLETVRTHVGALDRAVAETIQEGGSQ